MRFLPLSVLTSLSFALAAAGCASAADPESSSAASLSSSANDSADAGAPGLRIIAEPSDKAAALVAAINGAKTSLHMTMYLLTDAPIEDALIAQYKAGLDVKVILNEHFPFGSENKTVYAKLQAAGVPTVWASPSFTYTHEKSLVIDGETAWIMTANASASAYASNREYLAVDTIAEDVAETEAIFEADYAGTPITPTGNLLVSPVSMRSGIEALIGEASKTLDFEVEELEDTAIVSALCSARQRGVTVRGVVAATTQTNPEKTATAALDACGVTFESLKKPYIHAKAIVVDNGKMYVGSANFSATSLDKNRELGLVTSDAAAISVVSTSLLADIAAGTAI